MLARALVWALVASLLASAPAAWATCGTGDGVAVCAPSTTYAYGLGTVTKTERHAGAAVQQDLAAGHLDGDADSTKTTRTLHHGGANGRTITYAQGAHAWYDHPATARSGAGVSHEASDAAYTSPSYQERETRLDVTLMLAGTDVGASYQSHSANGRCLGEFASLRVAGASEEPYREDCDLNWVNLAALLA